MKNFVQPGNVVTVTAPAAVSSGDGVMVGAALFGVATHDAANGAALEIITEGVVEIAKTSALAIAVGDRLYWDAGSGVVFKTATGNILVGIAVAAAANPSATVKMKLAPGVVTGA